MKIRFTDWLVSHWYNEKSPLRLLKPLGLPFLWIGMLRRWIYLCGIGSPIKLQVPVIVVGNISVGGTGKTPMVIWLMQKLRAEGWKPGIVSRGYGGTKIDRPQWVGKQSNPSEVGDEPVLMAIRTGCPIAVGSNRVLAAQMILDNSDCNLIVSDDGLQHYRMDRDIEIAVIDGQRRFGNGCSLPIGPLREPIDRLKSVDLIVSNGSASSGEYSMELQGNTAVNLYEPRRKIPLEQFSSDACHAVAGIGNPQRFFKHLRAFGVSCEEHEYPDHHEFCLDDFGFAGSSPLLMTEKDAVKCKSFAQANYWYVPVDAQLDQQFWYRLKNLLVKFIDG